MHIAEWGLLTLAGLTGSLHCLGMCGAFPAALAARGIRWDGLLAYNGGRVFTYLFLGTMAGHVGDLLVDSGMLLPAQQGLARFLGAGMLVMGLGMALRWRMMDFPVPGVFADLMRGGLRRSSLLLGLVNGFLPCPLVYGMLLKAAATRSPLLGGGVLLAFGVGTLPAMFLVGQWRRVLPSGVRLEMSRLPGVILAVLGGWTLWRGG